MPTVTQDPLAHAAAALASDPTLAERLARTIVARNPADPRGRLILASALRRLARPAEALPILTDLAHHWPRAGRTRYELGLCLAQTGRVDEATAQLEQAVQIEPALVDAWDALADLCFRTGNAARERQARAAVARLSAATPQLGRAAELVALARHAEAEPLLRALLAANPRDAQAARLLAQCCMAHGATHHAETLLRHALAIAPDSTAARFDLAHALFAGQQAAAALRELAPLLARDPANPAWRNLQAGCLALLGDDAGAEAIHAELAAAFPGNARIAINHGHALRTHGARDAAIAAYRRAATLDPRAGEAWWGLANLKVGALGAEDEARMRALLAGPLADEDRLHLAYALGRRCEDAGDVAQAFAHYSAGAALARRRCPAAGRDHRPEAQAIARRFTPAFLVDREGQGAADDAPIFVVGLPRSGSTLVEQILASHPAVEGTMELPYIGALATRITREAGEGGLDAALATAGADQLRHWGQSYLDSARVHRRLGRARFIDKMPNNFRHIGLIRLILPQARIVDVRRHPMAACFSAFKQLFAEGQDFSYDLADLGRWYRHYLAIVRHFHAVQPGAVHTLVYEDLVEDTEAQVRALLAALGLPFDPATLRFFENDRAVRTVSSEQVRQPIYRSGLDHWRAFEPFLQPLAHALGPDLHAWRT